MNPAMNPTMNQREILRSVSVARLGFGLLGLLFPRTCARLLLGRETSPGAGFLVRLWGSREVALGMVTLSELEHLLPSRRVVEFNTFADASDAVAGLLARRLPWRTRLVAVLGGLGAAAVSAQLLRELEAGSA